MAAEQRRSAVIGPASFLHLPSAVIGITIETAIAAGIVKSEVYASGTPALGTLVLILLCVDRAAGKLCDQFAVDTAAVPDIAIGQINFSAQVSIARPQDAAMEDRFLARAEILPPGISRIPSGRTLLVIVGYMSIKLIVHFPV